MLRRLFYVRCLFMVLAVLLGVMLQSFPAQAAAIDPSVVGIYITEPIALNWMDKVKLARFHPKTYPLQTAAINCMNCHVVEPLYQIHKCLFPTKPECQPRVITSIVCCLPPETNDLRR